jgi:hypothetical protein
VKRDTSHPSAPLVFSTFTMLLAPVTNWERHCNARRILLRHEARDEVQIVTPYRVSHLQR